MNTADKVLIIGAGPSGLAASLLFADLGYQNITVVERRSSAADFEKNKAFTYQIDGRGQKLLKRLRLIENLETFGVANKSFHATTVLPNGSSKTIDSPIIDKDRVTCYWTTRRNLQTLLFEAVEKRTDKAIKLLYDHTLCSVTPAENKQALVTVTGPQDTELKFSPDILLACDGLSSTTRRLLSDYPGIPEGHFEMLKYPSPSAKLYYKVLNLPPKFSIKGKQSEVNDHRMAYVFPSRHKKRNKAMALFGFPVATSEHPRCVNIIREADHHLWTLEQADDLIAYLTDAFPQLDIPNLISKEEATDFVSLNSGKFPSPQHALSLYACTGKDETTTHSLLIGDAAHAFPPDLGLGVNSAFEDLYELETFLRDNPDTSDAFTQYQQHRLVESKALVKLVQTVFPYQYNQSPWRMKTWVIRFLIQRALHKLMPWLISKPAFQLVQNHTLKYSRILQQKTNADRLFYCLPLLMLIVLWLLVK